MSNLIKCLIFQLDINKMAKTSAQRIKEFRARQNIDEYNIKEQVRIAELRKNRKKKGRLTRKRWRNIGRKKEKGRNFCF